MLLTSWRKEIFRPECNPGFESLHCIAHLDQEVGPALPYLNTTLGGYSYQKEPPAVTFRVHGRLITVHHDRIALNALNDEAEADKILAWLQGEINQAWEQRGQITPSTESAAQPQVMEIVRLLPNRAGCGACGRPTCLVFATLAAQGVLGPADCPELEPRAAAALEAYLAPFDLDL
ncbi:MAG: Fe-S cluster protein [Desulfarculaceae bacterium]|nr:Fe-S cluster protein [Desulfarculaceae bacterium]MCF8070865.1 Fe-S cluster protein [Desulfarculaceae bacterium]MCF8100453.1 Fe-S cluster protein [Desulfarculaceae bacterium]MCF8117961.1 Fe-S cluster protein [Desulfarculaceae bacterium]